MFLRRPTPAQSYPIAGLLWLLLGGAAAATGAEQAIPRHPLETRALTEPEAVLELLPPEISTALRSGDKRELALLYLAQANACRVVANWSCQRDAGALAQAAAEAAGQPILMVRGQIADARGSIALQDYARGEHLLGQAELQLEQEPHPSLQADVDLAYSSLSFALGKIVVSVEYAERGLAALGDAGDKGMRVRLLRNRARAQTELGQQDLAREALQSALLLVDANADPKLAAEVHLETARLAHLARDVATMRLNGERVLELAVRLGNAQLAGQAHDVLGFAASDQADYATAAAELDLASTAFRGLDLQREELRVLRERVRVAILAAAPRAQIEALVARFLEIEQKVAKSDRAQASADFDARRQYAAREVEVVRLQDEAQLADVRERALTASNRLISIVVGLALAVLIALAVLVVLQRRFTRRLQRKSERLRESEARLTASEGRLRAVADNIPALIAQFDGEQRYLFANAYNGKAFGVDPSRMLGRTLREVRGEAVYADVKDYAAAALRGERVGFEGKTEVNGQFNYYHSNYVPDVDANGRVVGFFALTFDITPMKLAEIELDRLARFDSLTGVANRRHFDERLAIAVVRSQRQRTPLALLALDIDHFKPINDTLGHPIGDEVLLEFGRRLVACVRAGDLVARIGGDEFVVLIEDAATIEAAEGIARKLVQGMQVDIVTSAGALRVTASVGIAYFTQSATTMEIVAAADAALYAAKAGGRNTYRVSQREYPAAAALG